MTKEQPEAGTSQSRGGCQEPFQSTLLRAELRKQNRKTETVQKITPNPNTHKPQWWPLARLSSQETSGTLELEPGPDCGLHRGGRGVSRAELLGEAWGLPAPRSPTHKDTQAIFVAVEDQNFRPK